MRPKKTVPSGRDVRPRKAAHGTDSTNTFNKKKHSTKNCHFNPFTGLEWQAVGSLTLLLPFEKGSNFSGVLAREDSATSLFSGVLALCLRRARSACDTLHVALMSIVGTHNFTLVKRLNVLLCWCIKRLNIRLCWCMKRLNIRLCWCLKRLNIRLCGCIQRLNMHLVKRLNIHQACAAWSAIVLVPTLPRLVNRWLMVNRFMVKRGCSHLRLHSLRTCSV